MNEFTFLGRYLLLLSSFNASRDDVLKSIGFQRKVYVYGERLVDRIDFEELALKSVDPNLGPKITKFGHSEAEVPEPGTPMVCTTLTLSVGPTVKLTKESVCLHVP